MTFSEKYYPIFAKYSTTIEKGYNQVVIIYLPVFFKNIILQNFFYSA